MLALIRWVKPDSSAGAVKVVVIALETGCAKQRRSETRAQMQALTADD
ncbi:MAG: hypothetical protein ABI538_10220 [Pseudoxanthomonas sp.]